MITFSNDSCSSIVSRQMRLIRLTRRDRFVRGRSVTQRPKASDDGLSGVGDRLNPKLEVAVGSDLLDLSSPFAKIISLSPSGKSTLELRPSCTR